MPNIKSKYHSNDTVYIEMKGEAVIALTPGVNHDTHSFHIIQQIRNWEEKEWFESSFIVADYSGRPFLNMRQLYLYCLAEETSWESLSPEELLKRKHIYDWYDSEIISKGWGRLADNMRRFENAVGWEYIHPDAM